MIALFGWIPVVFALFELLPARRAMLASSISAWLLLPPTGIDLPGLPSYDKAVAATLGILLATVIYELHRLVDFRFRWFDAPMLLWCVCPFFSSISNGLGAYDGLAAVFRQVTSWLFPYLVGRLYLTSFSALRDLALGMVIGGVFLVPLCLFEMRMSPQLLPWVYTMRGFEGTRYGGYRPHVFFATGLELGLWMNAVTLVALWLWRTGQLKRLWGKYAGLITVILLITTILCKSTGATALLLLGLGSLWICWRTKTKWVMWAVLSIAPIYYGLRVTDLWSGRSGVELVQSILGDERAYSLEFRLINEDFFIAKTLQRPLFGWGGWGRNFVYDETGRVVTIIDQLTIIAFSSNGYVGLVAMTGVFLLPPFLFLRRFDVEQWTEADLAPTVAIAVVLNLYLLDCMFNGMLNVIYLIAAGGLLNVVGYRAKPRPGEHDHTKAGRAAKRRRRRTAVQSTRKISASQGALYLEPPAGLSDPREGIALRYQTLGRDSKAQGRFAEAKAMWLRALDVWTELTTDCPDHPLLRSHWSNCANDLAWLLANAADPAVRDPAHAIALAGKAAESIPDCGAYCNTLGAAHYRAGDFNAAIAALGRAISLTEGGTAFDHVFMAMAHARLGDQERAQHWLDQAGSWMEQHSPDHSELACLRDEARSVVSAAADSSLTAH